MKKTFLLVSALLVNINLKANFENCSEKLSKIIENASSENVSGYIDLNAPAHKRKKDFITKHLSGLVGNRLFKRTYVDDQNGETKFYKYRKCEVSENCVLLRDNSRDIPFLTQMKISFKYDVMIKWVGKRNNPSLSTEVTENQNILYVPENFKTLTPKDRDTVQDWLRGTTLQPFTGAGDDIANARRAVGDPRFFWKDSQKKAFRAIEYTHNSKANSLLIVGSTGLGKTEIILKNLEKVLSKKEKIHFVVADKVHLVNQLYKDIDRLKEREGARDFAIEIWHHNNKNTKSINELYEKSKERTRPTIVVTTVDSLKILLGEASSATKDGGRIISPAQKEKNYTMLRSLLASITFDEAHHIGARQSENLLNELIHHKDSNAFLFGTTATPFHEYLDIQGFFKNVFWAEIDDVDKYQKSLKKQTKSIGRPIEYVIESNKVAVDKGELSPINSPVLINPNNDKIGKLNKTLHIKDGRSGRYILNQDEEVNEYVAAKLLPFWNKHKFSFISASSITETMRLTKFFNDYAKMKGLSRTFAYWHSGMSEDEQQEVIELFKKGVITDLVTIYKLDEGINVPQLGLYVDLSRNIPPIQAIQRIGRVQRNFPGKKESDVVTFASISEDNLLKDMAQLEILDRLTSNQLSNKKPSISKKMVLKDSEQSRMLYGLRRSQTSIRDFLGNFQGAKYYAKHEIYQHLSGVDKKFSDKLIFLVIDLVDFIGVHSHLPYIISSSSEEIALYKRMQSYANKSKGQFSKAMGLLPSYYRDMFYRLQDRQQTFGELDREVALLEKFYSKFNFIPEYYRAEKFQTMLRKIKESLTLDTYGKYLSDNLRRALRGEVLNSSYETLSFSEKLNSLFGMRKQSRKASVKLYEEILNAAKRGEKHWKDGQGASAVNEKNLYQLLNGHYIKNFSPQALPFIYDKKDWEAWEMIQRTSFFQTNLARGIGEISKKGGHLAEEDYKLVNALRILFLVEDFPNEDLAGSLRLIDYDVLDTLLKSPITDPILKLNLYVLRYSKMPQLESKSSFERYLALYYKQYENFSADDYPEKLFISKRVNFLEERGNLKNKLDFLNISFEMYASVPMINDIKVIRERFVANGYLQIEDLETIKEVVSIKNSFTKGREQKNLVKFLNQNKNDAFVSFIIKFDLSDEKMILVNNFDRYAKTGRNPFAERGTTPVEVDNFQRLKDLYEKFLERESKFEQEFSDLVSYDGISVYNQWLNRKGDSDELFRTQHFSRDEKIRNEAEKFESLMEKKYVPTNPSKHYQIYHYINSSDPTVFALFIESVKNPLYKRNLKMRREIGGKFPKLAYDLELFVRKYRVLPSKDVVDFVASKGGNEKEMLALLKRMSSVKGDLGDKYDDYIALFPQYIQKLWEIYEQHPADYGKILKGRKLFKREKATEDVGAKPVPIKLPVATADPKAELDPKISKSVKKIDKFFERDPNFDGDISNSDLDPAQISSFKRNLENIFKASANQRSLAKEQLEADSAKRFFEILEYVPFEQASSVFKWKENVLESISSYERQVSLVDLANLVGGLSKAKEVVGLFGEDVKKQVEILEYEREFLEKNYAHQKKKDLFADEIIEKLKRNSSISLEEQIVPFNAVMRELLLDRLYKNDKLFSSWQDTFKKYDGQKAIPMRAFDEFEGVSLEEIEKFLNTEDLRNKKFEIFLKVLVWHKRLEDSVIQEEAQLNRVLARQLVDIFIFCYETKIYPRSNQEGRVVAVYQIMLKVLSQHEMIWNHFTQKIAPFLGDLEFLMNKLNSYKLRSVVDYPESYWVKAQEQFVRNGSLPEDTDDFWKIIHFLYDSFGDDFFKEEIFSEFSVDMIQKIKSRLKNESIGADLSKYEEALLKKITNIKGNQIEYSEEDIKSLFYNVSLNKDGTLRKARGGRVDEILSRENAEEGILDLILSDSALKTRLRNTFSSGSYELILIKNDDWKKLILEGPFKSLFQNLIKKLKLRMKSNLKSLVGARTNEDKALLNLLTIMLIRDPQLLRDSLTKEEWAYIKSFKIDKRVKLVSQFFENGKLPKKLNVKYKDTRVLPSIVRQHLFVRNVFAQRVNMFVSKWGGINDRPSNKNEKEVLELYHFLSKTEYRYLLNFLD